MTLKKFIALHRNNIEQALLEHLPTSKQFCTHRFNAALHYSVFPGGKRWRPVLTLLGGMIVGAPLPGLCAAACAIEYLHTSSIIIDDLPSMDDAELRRGKPCLHLEYDESTALMVAFSLMNCSYSLLVKTCRELGNSVAASRLIDEASELIGSNGMIGGQVIDLELREDYADLDSLHSRNLKTTALMRLMMTTGAIASGASAAEIDALAFFGEALGTAYQIADDLLDDLCDESESGKTGNQDQRHRRPSFVAKYGLNEAQRMADKTLEQGIARLKYQFGRNPSVDLLMEAATLIIGKNKFAALHPKYELVVAS